MPWTDDTYGGYLDLMTDYRKKMHNKSMSSKIINYNGGSNFDLCLFICALYTHEHELDGVFTVTLNYFSVVLKYFLLNTEQVTNKYFYR